MAQIGVPRKYEDGQWRHPWVPAVGDTRPEGMEMLCKVSGGGFTWEAVPVLAPISRERVYRIPADYIPPDGWRCLEWDEVVQDGDRWTHNAGGHAIKRGERLHNTRFGAKASEAINGLKGGGYIIRKEVPCKSDASDVPSAKGVASTSVSMEVDKDANCDADAKPVAWQFRKEPIPVETELVVLRVGAEIQAGDEFWNGSRWRHVDSLDHGQSVGVKCPVCRPRPIPQTWTIDTIPDGRCFECCGYTGVFWKDLSGCFWRLDAAQVSKGWHPSKQITPVDIVAELGEVK